MCGLTGFYIDESHSSKASLDLINAMTGSLSHRGPDDSGTWIDSQKVIALGHRRLSILDLSSAGHQPMSIDNNNFTIAYNGEIYNHLELRALLEKQIKSLLWLGTSDTETLLVAFNTWGIEATLKKIRGMFAIALWDNKYDRLHLIRDRFGEKPLYYGWIKCGAKNIFAFGSELKSLSAFEGFNNKVSKSALKEYFKYMYVPCPFSIYENIYKLEPGCILTIDQAATSKPSKVPLHSASNAIVNHENLSLNRWYDLKTAIDKDDNLYSDEAEAADSLERELKNVISLQSISDVPLGAFLSGGVDSSAIVSLMQQESMKPTKTFTIGFEDPQYDESQYALEVANYLGTDHTELIVTSEDALSIIPDLPEIYDEPFADSSQIPTYFVCKSAKQEVTVALSGDAGDELFGGYNRHITAPLLWKKINWLPFAARKYLGKILMSIPRSMWDGIINSIPLRTQSSFVHLGDKVHKTASRLNNVKSIDDLYLSLLVEPDVDSLLIESGQNYPIFIDDPLPKTKMGDPSSRMMFRDIQSYLADDILCKVDRAAMSVSLETRVPFLDHRIVELAWRMPISMKIKGREGKSILRNILYKNVPKSLIERPKAGFSIPLAEWLREPLRDWAEELLDPARVKKEGYLQSDYIQSIWQEHLEGKKDWTNKLWSILMFQSWLDHTAK
jgi:asparagine synthase (glutamine-hydrolysing)